VYNLFLDYYEAVAAGGGGEQAPGGGAGKGGLPRPTFETGLEEMKILAAVLESHKKRSWAQVQV
jgi:hypothetical protein